MEYKKGHRLFSGITFIIAAVILLIGKLGYLKNFNVWSIVFTIFLIAVIIKSIYPIHFGGILFPLAFLCIIYSKQLGLEALTPWTVLIAASLGTIGLSIIFHDSIRNIYHHSFHNNDYNFNVIDTEDDSNIIQKTSFGATTKYINSDDFKQADLQCSFGSMQIYFDRATIKSENAVARIEATCSTIELFVPKEWTIENRIIATLSSIEQKNLNNSDNTKSLILIGSINLSGITIIFV